MLYMLAYAEVQLIATFRQLQIEPLGDLTSVIVAPTVDLTTDRSPSTSTVRKTPSKPIGLLV